ncbi:MAG: GNAT family N-acetyltransferase [Deltaproteobacteria bacterium]
MIEFLSMESALKIISSIKFAELDHNAFLKEENTHNAWTEEAFLYKLPNKFVLSLAMLKNRELAGYSIAYEFKDKWAHISRVAIHPLFQRQGLGEMVLTEQLKEFNNKKIEIATIELEKDNIRAEKLYKKLGFKALTHNELSQYVITRERKFDDYVSKDSQQIVMANNFTDTKIEVLFKEKEKLLNESSYTPT